MSRINLYHSRRNMFNLCLFWERDESGVGNEEEYIYNKKPSGCFYAAQVNAENNNIQVLFDSFMADEHTITLESRDDLSGLRENSIVKYDNMIWRVEAIQKQIYKKESEYNPDLTYVWYIQLRR